MATHTSVLVVGGGPTGLMMALQLARRGVKARIIDKGSGPAQQTRALGVQARTLEIYAHLGIADRALQLGKRTLGGQVWIAGRKAAMIPLGDIGRGMSPFPFLLILGQDDNEYLLGEALAAHGVHVEWDTRLVHLSQNDERASARIRLPDGREEDVAASWVCGCDGSRSTVREATAIEFKGAAYDDVFYVADTTARGPMTRDLLNVYLSRGGFDVFFPMREEHWWRVVGILPVALRGKEGQTFDEVVPGIRAVVGEGLRFDECRWFSTYRIHHRKAVRFREGRCFLLGDAAHVHSPVGAQGMNTGLQDAYNLAWKLALVVQGRAGTALLDTYAQEREPVAETLLRTTDRAFQLVVADHLPARIARTRIAPRALALAMRFDRFRKLAFRTISQVGIRYPASRLSAGDGHAASAKGPRAGDRFPWIQLAFDDAGGMDLFRRMDDTRFTLLTVGPRPPTSDMTELTGGTDRLIDVLVASDTEENAKTLARHSIPRGACYLIRPDGHIGLMMERLDVNRIEKYLAERVGVVSLAPTSVGSETAGTAPV